MISEEDYKEAKAKNKALRKFLIAETDKTKALNAELDQCKIGLRERDEKIENLQFTNQRLVKRIEALQNKNEDQSQKSTSWGLWGSSISKDDLEKVTKQLKVTEEELEAKINENQLVHIKIFELKNELQAMGNSLDEIKHEYETKLVTVNEEKQRYSQVVQDMQKQLQQQSESFQNMLNDRNKAVEQCERDNENLKQQLQRSDQKYIEQNQKWNTAVPFDPWANYSNGIKSTGLLKVKQLESQESLVRNINSDFKDSLMEFLKSLKNMFDGQLPVGDPLPTQAKKTGAYLERLIEIVSKIQEQLPSFISQICDIIGSNKRIDFGQSGIARLFGQICDYLCNYLQDSANFENKSYNEAIQKSLIKLKMSLSFKQPNLNLKEILSCVSELQLFKSEMQLIATQFKKKVRLTPKDYETKSQNLVILKEDALQNMYRVIASIQLTLNLTNDCVNCFSRENELNVQTSLNYTITQAQLNQDSVKIKGEQGMSYQLQVELKQSQHQNKSRLHQLAQTCQEHKREAQESQAQTLEMKRQLCQEQTLRVNVQEDLARKNQVIEFYKLQCTCQKYDCAPLEIQITDEIQNTCHKVISLTQQNTAEFVTRIQDEPNQSLYQDVYNGLQKWAVSFSEGSQSKPVNDLTNNSDQYKLRLLQEKSLEKMLQMAQKMASMSRLSKGTSLQVMQRDREWQQKYDNMNEEFQTQLNEMAKKIKSLEDERLVVKRNYESQIRMLSEHVVELNSQIEKKQ